MNGYLQIRTALAIDNTEAAAKAAKVFTDNLSKINVSQLNAEKQPQMKKNLAKIKEAALKLTVAKNLNEQRQAFAQLTAVLLPLLKEMGPLDKPLFLQHCPMALNNQGAEWLSETEKILNPYLGQAMPMCGMNKGNIFEKK
ncbi:MAG: hypothetical protein Kow0037_31730 [Calditrichia bacterium]